jgi:hypothetical protein
MLTFALDVSPLIDRLDKMSEKLEEFPKRMADELTAWQTEDMNRRYPNTTEEGNSVSTEIWPTSRVVVSDQKKINAIVKARKAAGRPALGVARKGVPRPILRPELFTKLCERMDALMAKELTWR